ncbi:Deubiquitination-protection protein dph1 [Porphyridium purpureum]|uniref:Deubiquitination-protection protein dph1 n=1 Tax=Porphyridium purpureum TaxID=35688 RepID=A0A5J4YUU2_PORPP|nr:Deubiquitination-protection protein dph1 [Porphyridium purpureum]|eukprot:POR1571..scf209_3
MITIRVKQLDSSEFSVSVDPHASVAALKRQIRELKGLDEASQRLIFRGRVMQDAETRTLEQLGLEDGHAIHIVLRAPQEGSGSAAAAHAQPQASASQQQTPGSAVPPRQPGQVPGETRTRVPVSVSGVGVFGGISTMNASSGSGMSGLVSFLVGALESYGIPRDAAQRGAVTGAAASLTGSSQPERRHVGRRELIAQAWDALSFFASSVQAPALTSLQPPADDAAALSGIFSSLAAILASPAVLQDPLSDAAATSIRALAENPQNDSARAALMNLNVRMNALSQLLTTLVALSASVAADGELGSPPSNPETSSSLPHAEGHAQSRSQTQQQGPQQRFPSGAMRPQGGQHIADLMGQLVGQVLSSVSQGISQQQQFQHQDQQQQNQAQEQQQRYTEEPRAAATGPGSRGSGLASQPPTSETEPQGRAPGHGVPHAASSGSPAADRGMPGPQVGLQSILFQSLGPLIGQVAGAVNAAALNSAPGPESGLSGGTPSTARPAPQRVHVRLQSHPRVAPTGTANNTNQNQVPPAQSVHIRVNHPSAASTREASQAQSGSHPSVQIRMHPSGTAPSPSHGGAAMPVPSVSTEVPPVTNPGRATAGADSMGGGFSASFSFEGSFSNGANSSFSGSVDAPVPDAVASMNPILQSLALMDGFTVGDGSQIRTAADLVRSIQINDEGDVLGDPEHASEMERMLLAALEHLSINDLPDILLHGNTTSLARVRAPLCAFLQSEYGLDSTASPALFNSNAQAIWDSEVSRITPEHRQTLWNEFEAVFVEPRASDFYSGGGPHAVAVQLEAMMLRRIVEILCLVVRTDEVGDDMFPRAMVALIDHTVGELAYHLNLFCRRGWPDAQHLVRSFLNVMLECGVGGLGGALATPQMSVIVSMANNMIVQRITESFSRWEQRLYAGEQLEHGEQAEGRRISDQDAQTPSNLQASGTISMEPSGSPSPESQTQGHGNQSHNIRIAALPEDDVIMDDLMDELLDEIDEPPQVQTESKSGLGSASAAVAPMAADRGGSSGADRVPTSVPRGVGLASSANAFSARNNAIPAVRPRPSNLTFSGSSAGNTRKVARSSGAGSLETSTDSARSDVASIASTRTEVSQDFRDVLRRNDLPEDQIEKWQRILADDVEAMRKVRSSGGGASVHRSAVYREGGPQANPLESSVSSAPETLSPRVASRMGSQLVRRAMMSVRADPRDIDRVCSELDANNAIGGPLYMSTIEQGVRARLETDPDFDPSLFPNASERFQVGPRSKKL